VISKVSSGGGVPEWGELALNC